MQTFAEWFQNQNNLLLEFNSFSHLEQKIGDLVFFGIHILNKLVRDGGEFADFNIQNFLTPIVGLEPVQGNVLVEPKKSIYSMGYRSKYLNQKTRSGQVRIPKDYLEDISFLVPNYSNQKLWVVVIKKYGQSHYQQNLLRNLRRLEKI